MMDNVRKLWTCRECDWMNIGHEDYCTACVLEAVRIKEINLSRVELVFDTDHVKNIRRSSAAIGRDDF